MIKLSIRRKIMGIAIALIVLMTITAVLSMVWVIEVGDRLQELTDSYIPAYGNLARTNIRSLERALALRRSVIEEIQSPSSDKIADIRKELDAKGVEVEREAQGARTLIHDLIEKGETFGNATALIDSRPALIQRWPIPAVNSTPRSSACLRHSMRETPRRVLTVFNVSTRCGMTSTGN